MVSIFLDGADLDQMRQYGPTVSGFTTNPSLMRKCGVTRYEEFARAVLDAAGGKPVSFEVLADEPAAITRQARLIQSWGENVHVKLPIVDTMGTSLMPLAGALVDMGIRLNITAVMTLDQVILARKALRASPGIISVFAGRVADGGIDPYGFMLHARRLVLPPVKLLWASARQPYDALLARKAEVDIITLPRDLLVKCALAGCDMDEYSRATVRQFHDDAKGIEL